jgi:hypothetical protein
MKTAAFVFLVIALAIPLRADILVNGDFADGHAHWKGDAKDPDGSTVDLNNPAPLGGVTITLKKDRWTKIYQTFATRVPKLKYTITFKLSDDYSPDRHQPQNSGSYMTPGLDDIDGVPDYYGGYTNGQWMLILAQTGMSSSSSSLSPDVRKSGQQTLSGDLRGVTDEADEMTLVFAFPPGTGTITISKITLTPDDK